MKSHRNNKARITAKERALPVAERIRDWWVGKGCVEHSDRLRDFAANGIQLAIAAAVRAALARKKRRGSNR